MLNRKIVLYCPGDAERREIFAIIKESSGEIQNHRINFAAKTLTVCVSVEPENDAKFHKLIAERLDGATIFSGARGGG